MGNDNDTSRRKHRRSPSDEEAAKSSKRHKHRHHRHHRPRSKKHGQEAKQDGGNKQGGDEIAPPVILVASIRVDDDDDVEEGEILEEEGSGTGINKAVELCEEKADFYNHPGICTDKSDNGFDPRIGDKHESEVSLLCNSKAEQDNELVSRVGLEAIGDGNLGHEYHIDDKRRHGESGSPSTGSHKRKSYHDVDRTEDDENTISDVRKSTSSESSGDKYKTAASFRSQTQYHDEVHTRSRSMLLERSRSLSVTDEEALLRKRRYDERVEHDSDDERMARHSRGLWHGSRDLVRDVDRECSTNCSGYVGGEDKGYRQDVREKDRSREREVDRDRRREKGRDRSGDRETDWDRTSVKECKRSWDREVDRNRQEKEWERSWDREVDRNRREKERERSWDREVDRNRREKERERSRDREVDRDRRKEREWEKSRDRNWRKEKEQDRGRDRDLDAERRREKEQERGRDREVELERKRYKERDVSKAKDRTIERDRDRERERDKDGDRYRERDRVRDYDQESERDRVRQSDRNRDKDIKRNSAKVRDSNGDSLEWGRDKFNRDEDEQDEFEERIALKLAEQEEEDLNRIKEESRKRRQAILDKYKNQQLQQQNESYTEDVVKDEKPAEGHGQLLATVAPETFEDRIDGGDMYVAETSFSLGKSPVQNGLQASERAFGAAGLGEGTPKSERSDEKYCDDIFGETPVGVRKSGKGDGLPVVRSALRDNWDDPDGYYSYRFGEILDGRYEIVAAHGKGVFSTVVRAKDLKAVNGEPEEVAIKIIRNNETMRKAGDVEVSILKKLAGADPENKRHCVRFLSSFKYRNHLCLVFESLYMNLREVLKKFGRNIGLKLTAVRAYSKQLFIALKHLRNCGVLHSDIKPDNMLVNEAKNVLKLCDFGNAMFSGKNEITPYLVSRFYRAPEIILGLPYDHPMDMWSVGCCLYELYAGKVLFPGPTNNDMLRLHMELKGAFPKRMLKRGAFVDQHFGQNLNFHAAEEDPVTKKAIKRMIVNIKPKDIGSIVTGSAGEDMKMLANFKDLLEKIFVLDPEKRMTVYQALAHPFITGYLPPGLWQPSSA